MAKMMNYLRFDSCVEALDYYVTVFGAEVYFRMPVEEKQAKEMNIEGDFTNMTMHASFGVLGCTFLCSDSFGKEVKYTDSNQIMYDFNTEDEVDMQKLETFYQKIAAHPDTKIEMPLADQFWGGKMGVVTDKYGITWMLHAQAYSKLKMD